MSLGEILRKRREELDLTLDRVGEQVGFSKPYLSTIETCKVKNPPSDELLIKLEKVLKFEQGSLLHIAHVERMPADIRKNFESTRAESDKLKQIVKKIMVAKGDKSKINKLLHESNVQNDAHAETFSAGRLVPVINKVSAGYPTDFNDLDYPVGVADDYIRCPDLHDMNAFAVRVIGDSMEPKFREGDIVVFSPATEVKNGDDCFVRLATPHETAFKRVFFDTGSKVRLQPRNEKYTPLIIEGNKLSGIYKAVAKIEKL